MSAASSAPKPGAIAIVIPWYGAELRGGAETVARQVALRLAARGHAVEILTTCCRAFLEDWSVNHLPAGISEDQGVVVRRFPVGARDSAAFDRANGQLMATPRDSMKPGVALVDPGFAPHNIDSAALHDHLVAYADAYERILFTPYLYGPSLNAARKVAHKAVLQPCLHDESYAYLDISHLMVHAIRHCAFLSDGEADLAERIYGPAVLDGSLVVGCGIEPEELDPAVAATGDLGSLKPGSFLLYLGRRDATKGVDLLIQAWRQWKAQHPQTDLSLVLVGPGPNSYHDPASGIIDRGLVDIPTKTALLRACRALVHASRNESYSRSLMEAWHCAKPAVIHLDCPATAGAMDRCHAGWTAGEDVNAWAEAIDAVASASDTELARRGALGRAYADIHADWERCIDRYEVILGLRNRPEEVPAQVRKLAIDQVLTGFDYADAISEEALNIRNWLRAQGIDSNIIAQYINPRVQYECRQWQPGMIQHDRGMIYHHSIGAAINGEAIAHQGKKALIYHNITPPSFFAPYKADFARLLQSGLDDLGAAAASFTHLWADSAFNAGDLERATGRGAKVLPLPVPPAKWAVIPDQGLLAGLRAGGVSNILFVGRVAPNKCQHDLVRLAYHLLRMGVNARLCLVGQAPSDDPYVAEVTRLAATLGIASRVWIPNKVSVEELAAAWHAADVFVSLSEHEGFGVPLVEAMCFGVPVVAYACTAIPETMGKAGVLIEAKQDLVEAAALTREVLVNQTFRQQVLASQRERRSAFLPSEVAKHYRNLILPVFQ